MPNQKKQQVVEKIKEKLLKAKSVAVVDYQGTTVNDQVELRSNLKEVGAELLVAKNTLIGIASDKPELSKSLSGMNALVISYQDAVSALKALFKYHKDRDRLEIKQGIYEDRVVSANELEQLSKLPSKEELVATLISRIQSPAYGLVNTLKAGQRNLVQVLGAISSKS